MRSSTIHSRIILSTAAAVALFAFGCASGGSSPQDIMPNEFAGAPNWVIKGCQGFAGESEPTKLCGVGSFKGSSNISLARTAAMARGRTEIARSLGVKVRSMLKDYQATTTGGAEFGEAASDEQHVVDVSKQITDISLSGTEIQDTWISNSGTYYTLMVLDVEQFENSVNGMKRLSETIREAIVERAEAAFADLDDE
ncbi:MAG: LPP20 family lipoprotein [Deltaproteobacteria bacterium]|nr:LPP20 family lipoprotein [Deltaproteobacteria bacterium]MBW2390482.1 LPP20 family lipoprotein [Deltaproteobacteria bacterium]MBW2724509.1 LPP20 family lipoprotein [Deltaproteobacteria bacterium]